MPSVHKIALFGMGNISRILYAGAAALCLAETKQKESVFDSDMLLKILEPVDGTLLIKAYKNVQKRYYPEKDSLIKKEKGEL